MSLKIQTNKIFLKKQSTDVEVFDDELKKIVQEMKETMKENEGVGLAAPQIGLLKRFFIAQIDKKIITFINPEITKRSKGRELFEEGCLSLPGCRLEIERFSNIKIKAKDLNGVDFKMDLNGFSARVFQHEFDHLDGVLITDKVSVIKKIKDFVRNNNQ